LVRSWFPVCITFSGSCKSIQHHASCPSPEAQSQQGVTLGDYILLWENIRLQKGFDKLKLAGKVLILIRISSCSNAGGICTFATDMDFLVQLLNSCFGVSHDCEVSPRKSQNELRLHWHKYRS
jgi:hypothetical protein